MTLFAHRNDMTISLLIYPNDAPDKRWGDAKRCSAIKSLVPRPTGRSLPS
jgi:hypothetical protein